MCHGRAGPKDPLSSIYESLHDNSITQATFAFLKREKKVAAVMAGHDEPCDSQTYAAISRIARAVARWLSHDKRRRFCFLAAELTSLS